MAETAEAPLRRKKTVKEEFNEMLDTVLRSGRTSSIKLAGSMEEYEAAGIRARRERAGRESVPHRTEERRTIPGTTEEAVREAVDLAARLDEASRRGGRLRLGEWEARDPPGRR